MLKKGREQHNRLKQSSGVSVLCLCLVSLSRADVNVRFFGFVDILKKEHLAILWKE